MRLPIIALLPVFALLLIAIACEGNGGRPEATASPADTPQATATETAPVTPTNTPQADATETAQATPTNTPQADATPSPSPSDVQARLAVVAANQGDFLAAFQDVVIEGKTCDYDQDSLLIDCDANGVYQLDEGVQGADAICRVLLVEQQPVGLSCQEEFLAAPVYYEIQ